MTSSTTVVGREPNRTVATMAAGLAVAVVLAQQPPGPTESQPLDVVFTTMVPAVLTTTTIVLAVVPTIVQAVVPSMVRAVGPIIVRAVVPTIVRAVVLTNGCFPTTICC